MTEPLSPSLEEVLPPAVMRLARDQKAIPKLAKDASALAEIHDALGRMSTSHDFWLADSREADFLAPESVHLVVTSPPYWTLKRYNESAGQLGHVADYESFLSELRCVFQRCYEALVPGGRLVCVVGDVCLSRRRNNGRHTVVPLHASIQEMCRGLGYDNLAPIIWHKIANASYEVEGGSSFLGKPYEPNAVIKNDIEYILMERKPGGYRKPAWETRVMSVIPADRHKTWFQQVWAGLGGASTRSHPAPFPVELAERLIRMFSFAGDRVLDPFLGSGTTSLAASRCGRDSIGIEIDPDYLELARRRMRKETRSLFGDATLNVHDTHSPSSMSSTTRPTPSGTSCSALAW